MLISVRCTVPGNSSRSAKARRATPHGQGTPGRVVRSRTVGLAGNSGVTEGGDPKRSENQEVMRREKQPKSTRGFGSLAQTYARLPASVGLLGFSADQFGRLLLTPASNSLGFSLYRLDEIRHAQKRSNSIPWEKPQKPRNRQTFPTG